ncbi:MAG: radical SAM protein [Anaerolineales bacterium]
MSLRHLPNLLSNHLTSLPLAVLYLTDGCNSRCAMCDIWRAPRRNMPAEYIDALVEAVPRLGLRWVLLSGGEATQHPDWATIAGRFRAAGVYTMLLTNGLYTAKHADAVAANVDELIVSLDAATAPTYAAIRGLDALDIVIRGIEAVKARGVRVITRTTVMRGNYAELPAIIDLAKGLGVDQISFLPVDVGNPHAFGDRAMQAHSPALRADDIPALTRILDDLTSTHAADFTSGRLAESPDKLRGLVTHFRALLGDAPPPVPRCNAPQTTAVIDVDGTLRGCYFLPAYGQWSPDDDLRAALNRPEARAQRQAVKDGARAECAGCVCPLYKGPRALLAW